MNRVLAYDPRDLTLGVEPGVRIEDLLRVLAEQKQFLPLAVPFSDRATIGGIVAANSSSPLRHAYGGVRDFCLGMEFVTGEGVVAKSGGRVVKNVTGYDLHKLLIGSLGTLAVITRVNFRTFPLLPAQGTFVASFSDAEAAFGFCRAIAQSVLTPQIVEVADPGAAHFLFSAEAPARITPQQWSVVITAAGQPSVVDRHARELGHMASAANADRVCAAQRNGTFFRSDAHPRIPAAGSGGCAVRGDFSHRRFCPPPCRPLLGRLGELAAQNHLRFRRPYACIRDYVRRISAEEGRRDAVRRRWQMRPSEVFQTCAQPEISAPAMLEWCPAEVKRAAGGVWGPARQDFALMQRVKNVFDPQNVLSPGRFAGGI